MLACKTISALSGLDGMRRKAGRPESECRPGLREREARSNPLSSLFFSHNIGDDAPRQRQNHAQDHGAGAQRCQLAEQPRIVENGKGGCQDQAEDGAVGLDAVLFKQVGDQLGDEEDSQQNPDAKGTRIRHR